MQPTIQEAIEAHFADPSVVQPVSMRDAVKAVRDFVGKCSHTDDEIEGMILEEAAGHGIAFELDRSHDGREEDG